MPCRDLVRVGANTPFAGLDLDTQPTGRLRLQRWTSIADCGGDAIASFWVPAGEIERVLPRLKSQIDHGPPSSVQILIDGSSTAPPRSERDQLVAAIKLRREHGESVRVGVVVRPYQIESTRVHLNAITALRLQASEWDVDLALDLSRQIDWLWEAEAAIHRLMPSLRVIRLSFPTQTFDGRFRTSLTQRALNAAAEMGFTGTISLVIPLPLWHWRNAAALEASARVAAVDISDRFARRQMPDILLPGQTSLYRDP